MADEPKKSSEGVKSKPRRKPVQKPRQLPPYNVVLLDDDEHTYEYVIDMLRSLFAHGEERAFQLAQQVDQTGRAIVCTTHRERAEFKRDQILGYGNDARLSHCNGSMRAVVEPAEAADG